MEAVTGTEIQIRPAEEADHVAICRLLAQADELHIGWHPEYFRLPEDGQHRTLPFLRQWIAHEQSDILLAIDEAGLVGLAMVFIEQPLAFPIIRPEARWVTVDNLVVDASRRQQGIGSQLLQAVHAWARERGVGELRLKVYERNEEARQFYDAQGFTPLSHELRRKVE
ncbi:MAG: GNAT family N-acetyltransferase [Bacteroidetes bacterium]|nr:MAG: GNAT family N-acetyltransferase [Bacteroidota bacterium]